MSSAPPPFPSGWFSFRWLCCLRWLSGVRCSSRCSFQRPPLYWHNQPSSVWWWFQPNLDGLLRIWRFEWCWFISAGFCKTSFLLLPCQRFWNCYDIGSLSTLFVFLFYVFFCLLLLFIDWLGSLDLAFLQLMVS